MYGRAYYDALGDLPLEYSLINPDRPPPITGQPGVLFAQSFGFPIMPRTRMIARWLQKQEHAFIHDIAEILDEFDEGGDGGLADPDWESASTTWRLQSPIIARDLRLG